MRASIHRAMLRYDGGLVVNTAASGAIGGLDTLYLRLVEGDIEAVGEVRINIAYLNGLEADAVLRETIAVTDGIDWRSGTIDPALINARASGASAPVRMLLDCALHDLEARRRGVSVAGLLKADGGGAPLQNSLIRHATNQTLFFSPDNVLLDSAARYVKRGFRDLKLRIGAPDFTDDLRRLGLLRERFGESIELAADANGAWTREEATANLRALEPFGLRYVEQPIPPHDPCAMLTLAQESAIPLMLDESVASEEDLAFILAAEGRLWAHLKLVKLGGLTPALSAARALGAAGVPFMIGQMNEGGIATAAALHLADAARPQFAELYGADGLANDPASGLVYGAGQVSCPDAPGFGLTFDASRTQLIREYGS